jgi:hypothetical protein
MLHPTTTIRKRGQKYRAFRNIIGYVTIANSFIVVTVHFEDSPIIKNQQMH